MIAVTLPRLSLSMEEGKVARWLVGDGAQVKAGQVIVEIETDKAVAEVEAPATGKIRRMAEEGAIVAVEARLAEIDDGIVAAAATPQQRSLGSNGSSSTKEPTPSGSGVEVPRGHKHRASPAARRIARERGIGLGSLSGSGPDERITVRDLGSLGPAAKRPLRDAIIAQLEASWRDIPHIQIGGELDGTGLVAAKQASPADITITDLLVLALVRAVRAVPELNGLLGRPSQRVHVALAVASPSGVVSPVMRNAHALSLAQIARERARLVAAARADACDRRDLAGGTITLTNLGAYPVDFFAPIISGPQIAMIATGRLLERPVARGGKVVIGHRIWTNVAIDHRGADGVAGARFLAAFERALNGLPG